MAEERVYTPEENELRQCSIHQIALCLSEHRKDYPLGEEEDWVKFVFQAMLGAGHLISSEMSALRGLKNEMAFLKAGKDEPLYERLSLKWCRLNLRPAMAEGMRAEEIALLLTRSAEKTEKLFSRQDVYDFCMSIPETDTQKMERAASRILSGLYLPSHSTVYHDAYHPAYRVLRNDLIWQD